jgi:hypothetical protein
MAKTGNRKPGGGYGSRVNAEKGVRNGDRAKVVNPRALSQIGQSLGNRAGTDMGAKNVNPVETMYGAREPKGGPGGVPLGNAVALNVGKGGGVGTGRKLYGQSGSNQTYGSPAKGVPELPSTRGQWPD